MALSTILGIGSLISGLFGGGKSATSASSETQSTTSTKAAQQFSPEVLAPLESLMKTLLTDGSFATAQQGLTGQLGRVNTAAAAAPFDVDAFVNDTMARATSGAQFDLESGLNKLFSATGTSETDNSMTALLANRLRTDTASNLAGIGAQARATGEQIRTAQSQGQTSEIVALSNSIANQMLGLLDIGKGSAVTSQESTQSTKNATGNASEQESFFDRLSKTLGSFAQSAASA